MPKKRDKGQVTGVEIMLRSDAKELPLLTESVLASATRIVVLRPLLETLSAEESFLQRRHFRLREATSAAALIELVHSVRPEVVVLSDERLRVDPVNLLDSLKQAAKGAPTQFIMIAGRSYPRLERLVRSTDPVVLLRAPVHPEEIFYHLVLCLRLTVRKHVRRTVLAEVLGDERANALLGTTKVLTEGGMLLDCGERLGVGTRLQVNFTLPNNTQIYAQVEVANVRSSPQGQYRIGMRFTKMCKEFREKLTDFLGTYPEN